VARRSTRRTRSLRKLRRKERLKGEKSMRRINARRKSSLINCGRWNSTLML
jgi:hypothetical protein